MRQELCHLGSLLPRNFVIRNSINCSRSRSPSTAKAAPKQTQLERQNRLLQDKHVQMQHSMLQNRRTETCREAHAAVGQARSEAAQAALECSDTSRGSIGSIGKTRPGSTGCFRKDVYRGSIQAAVVQIRPEAAQAAAQVCVGQTCPLVKFFTIY